MEMRSGRVFVLLAVGLLCLLDVPGGSTSPSSSNSTELQKGDAEERAVKKVKSSGEMKSFLESSGGGAGFLFGNIVSGIGTLATTNFTGMSTEETVKIVGDAIVPIIAEGLNFIPVFGPLISGIFSGVWGLMSSLLGLPAQKSPLELLAEKMEEGFQKIRKEMADMQKKTLKLSAQQTEKRLGELMATITGSEISRNKYICDKYAAASHQVTQVLKSGHNITEKLQLEILIYLHDCDNFLKDTAEGFLGHTEFADVLWIPSVLTTLARVSFLTEVVNHRNIYRLDNRVVFPLWKEIKADIKKQLWYYGKYVHKRIETLYYDWSNLTEQEYEVCQMQQSLFYLDLDLYPYGVPSHKQIIQGNDSHLHLDKFVTGGSDKPVHVQIFRVEPRSFQIFINCFVGPAYSQMSDRHISMKITFVTNKSYLLRVLYLVSEKSDTLGVLDSQPFSTSSRHLKFSLHQDTRNDVKILMEKGKPNKDVVRVEFPTKYFILEPCPTYSYSPQCPLTDTYHSGKFVIESIEPFAVLPDKDETKAEGRITIQENEPDDESSHKSYYFGHVSLIGFEIVTLPLFEEKESV